MTKEKWLEITGWENYAVSTHGRIKRIRPCPMPPGHGYKPMKQIKPDHDRFGYHRILLYSKHGRKRFLVHRIVLTTFVRPPLVGEVANHLDGHKDNNHLGNLEWCTRSENDLHAVKLGLKPTGDRHWSRRHPELVSRGSKNGWSVLDEDTVKSIRSEYRHKYGALTALADKHRVSISAIHHVVTRRTWRHI